MGGYVHKPVTWNREASALWAAGQRDAAVKLCLEVLDADPAPDADACATGLTKHAVGIRDRSYAGLDCTVVGRPEAGGPGRLDRPGEDAEAAFRSLLGR